MQHYVELTYGLDSHEVGLGEDRLRNVSQLPKLDDVPHLPVGQVVLFGDYEHRTVAGVLVDAESPLAAEVEASERASAHLKTLLGVKVPSANLTQVFNAQGLVVRERRSAKA